MAFVAVSVFVPQRSTTSAAELARWHSANAWAMPAVDALGLDRVYSSWPFLVLMAVFTASMALATWDMVRLAWKRWSGATRSAGVRYDGVAVDEAASRARARGYRLAGTNADGDTRYVRYRFGHWGTSLLHVGMLLAIVSSGAMALTDQRGITQLVVGDSIAPGSRWLAKDAGVVTGTLVLPGAVRLDGVAPTYWPNGELKQVATTITLDATGTAPAVRRLSINDVVDFQDVRVYQGKEFGDAFALLWRSAAGTETRSVPFIAAPVQAGKASYLNEDVVGIPYTIKYKYVPDERGGSLFPLDPRLSIRVLRDQADVSRISLKKGESARIGAPGGGVWTVTFVDTRRWSELIFVRHFGVQGVFLGFIVIMVGASFIYAFAPREITLRDAPGGGRMWVRAARFSAEYREQSALIAGVEEDQEDR